MKRVGSDTIEVKVETLKEEDDEKKRPNIRKTNNLRNRMEEGNKSVDLRVDSWNSGSKHPQKICRCQRRGDI